MLKEFKILNIIKKLTFYGYGNGVPSWIKSLKKNITELIIFSMNFDKVHYLRGLKHLKKLQISFSTHPDVLLQNIKKYIFLNLINLVDLTLSIKENKNKFFYVLYCIVQQNIYFLSKLRNLHIVYYNTNKKKLCMDFKILKSILKILDHIQIQELKIRISHIDLHNIPLKSKWGKQGFEIQKFENSEHNIFHITYIKKNIIYQSNKH